jgi:hypothetical protein
MKEISFSDGVAAALNSLLNNRLAALAGAGLSMDEPSHLPSAATIAAAAKTKYDAMYGAARAPLAVNVEDQAEFFFQRGELDTVYFRILIDQHAFAAPPNAGHHAVADLLLVRAIRAAVTTNVDSLIETAGLELFGQLGVCIDGNEIATLPVDTSPLLKLHGCRVRDPGNMVWARGQLIAAPVATRIANSASWLKLQLLDRDLLIVGYWTDWNYLNSALSDTLGAVSPASVIVVDLADSATFAGKAPELFALGQRASIAFNHVRVSGAKFLDALRREFSRSFIRRVLHSGAADYTVQAGSNPDSRWLEPPNLDNPMLWQIRRDLEGRRPNEPAKDRHPPPESLVGLTILQLQARGAVADGPYWLLNGRRVRVLRAANVPLHRIEVEFEREMAPTVASDVVIAVGAEAQSLPTNFARAGSTATIVRSSKSRWMTRPEALQELDL